LPQNNRVTSTLEKCSPKTWATSAIFEKVAQLAKIGPNLVTLVHTCTQRSATLPIVLFFFGIDIFSGFNLLLEALSLAARKGGRKVAF
jgi:hypothetical protein